MKHFITAVIALTILSTILFGKDSPKPKKDSTVVKTDTLVSRKDLIQIYEYQYKQFENQIIEAQKQQLKITGRLEVLYGQTEDSLKVKK